MYRFLVCAIMASSLLAWAADGPASPEVRGVLTRLMSEDPAVRIAASREMAALGEGAAPVVADLVPLLGDRYFDVRTNLRKAIVAVGGDATPYLRKALGSDVYHVRRGALECLRGLGAPARAAAPDVVKLAKSGKGSILGVALGALASIDTDSLIEVCGPLLGKVGDVTESTETVSLLRFMAAAGKKAKPAVEPHARKLLVSSNRVHVLEGIELLVKVGADVDGNKEIAGLLERDKRSNWKWFCTEVKDQGKAGAWAIPHVIRLLDTAENPWVAATACTTLESIGPPEASTAVPHVIKALERPEAAIRRYAARTLFTLKADPETVLPVLRKTPETTKDERAREWLTEAIERISAMAAGKEPGEWEAD